VISKGINALKALLAAREGAFERSFFAVDDDVTLDFGLEFKDFAAVGGKARIVFFLPSTMETEK